MTETFYDLLGVSEGASTAEIEAAYREFVKEVHPDVSDDGDAAERTKRLNEAKRVLTDDAERRRYDRLGHDAYTGRGWRGPGTAGPPRGWTSDGADRRAGSGPADDGTTRREETASGDGQDGRRRDRRAGDRRDGDRRTTDRRSEDRSAADRRDSGFASDRRGDDPRTNSSETRRGGDPRSGGFRGARGRAADATGPSRASPGPPWQSSGGSAAAGAGGEAPTDSPSARRQAAAGSNDGPNVDWSWNGWERTRSWAVREGGVAGDRLHPSRLFPGEQSFVLLVTTFLLYPVFVVTVVFPPFPVVARATVAVCTVLMFAYLLSIPEVAVLVYGAWSLLVPVVILLVPGVGFLSLAGVVGLSATWVPLGLSVLALSVVRP